jgi:hypothetical protein
VGERSSEKDPKRPHNLRVQYCYARKRTQKYTPSFLSVADAKKGWSPARVCVRGPSSVGSITTSNSAYRRASLEALAMTEAALMWRLMASGVVRPGPWNTRCSNSRRRKRRPWYCGRT